MDAPGKKSESARENSSGAHQIDLASFLNFPSLSQLFQGSDTTALARMRSQLTETSQRLERVVRQGTKEEAERAILISRSYTLTLALLDELEHHFSQSK